MSIKAYIGNWKDIGIPLWAFSAGILAKLSIVHHNIGTSGWPWPLIISNFLIALGFFIFLMGWSANSFYRRLWLANFCLSLVLMMDLIYFKHFYTLMPIHSVFQLGQLGDVSDSILALLNPIYLLFFCDSILLRLLFSHSDPPPFVPANNTTLRRSGMKLMAITLALSLMGPAVLVQAEQFTPQNLGVFNYHLYDLGQFLLGPTFNHSKVLEAAALVEDSQQATQQGFAWAKNRNVIVIQAESLQSFVLENSIENQAITPVLNNLIQDSSLFFSRYYEQVGWGNTSDAEFISHNGFYPALQAFSYKAYENNSFVTLPSRLKEEGYSTLAFHGNEGDFWNRSLIYASQGLDRFISREYMSTQETIGIGISDEALFKESIQWLQKQNQPFYSFFVSLSSHHPFELPDHHRSLKLKGPFAGTLLEDYLQSIHYFDQSLGIFIKELKKTGLYDQSILVIYGDHQGLDYRDKETNQLMESFLGKPYREDEMFRVPLLIHIPGLDSSQRIETVGGQIDFSPTLANLLGLSPKKYFFGQDLLNAKEGFVAKQVHVAQGSFIDDEKVFIMSPDGIFENSQAWSLQSGTPIDVALCRDGYDRAVSEILLSTYIMNENLAPLFYDKGLEAILQMQENQVK